MLLCSYVVKTFAIVGIVITRTGDAHSYELTKSFMNS
jgi:hypothetical protein